MLDDWREVRLPVLKATGVGSGVELVELLGEDGEALAILVLQHVEEALVDHVVDVVAGLDHFSDVIEDGELPLHGVTLVLLLPESLNSVDLATCNVLLVGIPEVHVDHRAGVGSEMRRKIESSPAAPLVDGLEGYVEELVEASSRWRELIQYGSP